jgi:hypothetical protein
MLGIDKHMTINFPHFFSNYCLFSSLILILIFFLILGTTIQVEAQVQGQGILAFYANLSSNEEVPPNESNATGMAVFLFKNDSSEVSFLVNSTGLNEITQSNIYNGSTGMNGEAVVPLSDEKTKIEKNNSSIQYQDQIKTDDLIGTLDGKEIISLVDLMSNGSAYVNIHTEQYIDGAIRGQIVRGQVQMNGDAITGLAVPGGLIGLSGISLQGGTIIFSPGGIIGFIPIAVPGGSQTGGANGNTGGTVGDGVGGVVGGVGDGVGGVVGGVGGVFNQVGETADKLSGTVDKTSEYVGEEAGNIANTVDDAANDVDDTIKEIDDDVVKKILDNDGDSKDSDSGDSKDSDSGDSKDSDSGDSKDSDSGDSKDSDSGDSKDSDSGDSKDSDDGGDSVTDKVKKLLD